MGQGPRRRRLTLDALVATFVAHRELLPALAATGTQYVATVYRRHALAESVLVATLADRGLEGSLAHDFKIYLPEKGRQR